MTNLSVGANTAAVPAAAPARNRAARLRLCLLVFVGYYLGALLGLALTFYPTPLSVLWPPNAFLFAAMLVVPTRSWPLVIGAALPAHLLAELSGGVPVVMALCWFVSNVAEAAIGAGCMRLLLRRPLTFQTVRDVSVFLGAAIVAVFLSSFIDSAFVVLNRWGEKTYWELWQARLLSNVTASLTFVPVIVTWVSTLSAGYRRPEPARLVEAIVLAGALLAVTAGVFDSAIAADASPVLMYLPIPFLLWSAFRFGPLGASTSFATVAILVIWGTGHGLGPFATRLPAENAFSVQLFLAFAGPALLWLAAALAERSAAGLSWRESHRRFRLVLQATNNAVYEREMATDAIWWSENALIPLGYAARQRPADYAAMMALVHPDDHQRVRRVHAVAIESGQPHWTIGFRLRRTDGSYAHVHEQGFIVRDATTSARQFIGSITDVTERHDTDELRHRLAVASRFSAMGQLSASIAHEINQPIAAILANVDAAELLLEGGRGSAEDLRSILNDIRDDDLRASDIIRHMRALNEKRDIELHRLDINEILRSVLRLVERTMEKHSVTIWTDFDDALFVRADRTCVQQVLLNLLLNAADAMSAVPLSRRYIHIAITRAGRSEVTVSVSDQGHGIAASDFERIFEAFYTKKPNGMGLGLSIARSLVQCQGGRIWAENNDGAGATFHFTLQADEAVPTERR